MLFKKQKCVSCDTYYDPTLEQCPECHKNNPNYTNRGISKDIVYLHPAAQVGLFLVGFAYIGMLISEIIFTICFRSLENEIYRKTIILTATYLMMFAGLLTIVFTTRRKVFFKKFTRPTDYIYGLAYAITIVCVSGVVSSIVSLIHPVADNNNQEAAIQIAKNYPIIALFILGTVGPLCEELTYRVGLYSFLRRIHKWVAIPVTVIIFALIHFDFTSSDMVTELLSLPSYIAAGAVLTIAYEHRGPACSMTAHMIYNTFAFILMLLK